MKRLVIVLAAVLAAAGLPAQSVKFTIGEWAPYTGEQLAGNGLASEMVSAACLAAGLTPTLEFGPWKRAEAGVVEGTVFATFPYTDIAERKGKFLFSDTLFTSSFAVVVHKANAGTKGFTFTSADSFKGKRVGVTAGTDAVKNPLLKAGALVEETPSLDQSIKKLELGRIDFVIDDRAVIFDSIKTLYPGDAGSAFQILDKAFGDKTAFKVMASLKFAGSAALVKKLNSGLAKIAADGTQQKILAQYGLGR